MAIVVIEIILPLAIRHHQAGRLERAEALYRQILVEDPAQPDALHLLGILAGQTGRLDVAVDLITRAIVVKPAVPEFHANLAETQRRLGNTALAIASFRRALQLHPASAETHNNLAIALTQEGQLDEAVAACNRAIALAPQYPDAHYTLAMVQNQRGNRDEAIAAYIRAIALKPDYAEAHNNLGSLLKESGKPDDAMGAFAQAIAIRPKYAEAHNNLGVCLREKGRLDEAIAAYRRAIQLKLDYAAAYSNLGNALVDKDRVDEAIAACNAAIGLRPDFAEAHHNLAMAFKEKGLLDEALAETERAIALQPDLAVAVNLQGNIFKDQGKIEEALACYERAMVLAPTNAAVHSNVVYTLHFLEYCDPATLLAEHRRWMRRHADPLQHLIRPYDNDRSPERRLRIGYVSPDFRAHPVGRFLLPLLANHDHQQFEIYCYAAIHFPDDWTPRLRAHADVWRDIRDLSDDEAVQLIRQDRIDILVDLAMHMGCNRLLIFAQKPAPVQVTYLAYCGTTGLETMDYRLTDRYLDPPGSDEQHYTERSIRLAGSYWCYDPPLEVLELSPPPALAAGHITFGCLNNFCKITPSTLQTWLDLLRTVPDSRLLLHAAQGDHRQSLRDVFSRNGVDPRRLAFADKLSLPEYMRQYSRIDIALDPFPYAGGTTTCDALWMGVPVITLPGATAISRSGVSLLTHVGLPELIAQSSSEYVRIAADLAGDLARLAGLRSTLRQRMQDSPLMDAPRFARNVEAAYRQMWRSWCQASLKDVEHSPRME